MEGLSKKGREDPVKMRGAEARPVGRALQAQWHIQMAPDIGCALHQPGPVAGPDPGIRRQFRLCLLIDLRNQRHYHDINRDAYWRGCESAVPGLFCARTGKNLPQCLEKLEFAVAADRFAFTYFWLKYIDMFAFFEQSCTFCAKTGWTNESHCDMI